MHFCEFSPNGRYLLTGSIDGTAKIWNMESVNKCKKEGFELSDDKLVVTLEEKRVNKFQ
jgi:WD40 repeat protein